jgi:hypothetical protein
MGQERHPQLSLSFEAVGWCRLVICTVASGMGRLSINQDAFEVLSVG